MPPNQPVDAATPTTRATRAWLGSSPIIWPPALWPTSTTCAAPVRSSSHCSAATWSSRPQSTRRARLSASRPSQRQADAAVVEHQRRMALRGEPVGEAPVELLAHAGGRRDQHRRGRAHRRARRRSGPAGAAPSAQASATGSGRSVAASVVRASVIGVSQGLHVFQPARHRLQLGRREGVEERSLMRPSALFSAGNSARPAGCSHTCCVRASTSLARRATQRCASMRCTRPDIADGARSSACASRPIVAPSSRASTNSTPLCAGDGAPSARARGALLLGGDELLQPALGAVEQEDEAGSAGHGVGFISHAKYIHGVRCGTKAHPTTRPWPST